VPELTANQRQRGPRMAQVRAALAGLRSGVPADTRAALDRLAPTAASNGASPARSCSPPWSATGTPNTTPTAAATPPRSAPGR